MFVLLSVILGGDQLGGDLTVSRDGQLAEIGELGLGLCQHDVIAILVGDSLAEFLMGMAVEHGVDTVGILDDSLGGPIFSCAFHAQVCNGDNIFRAFGLSRIDGGLDSLIQSSAVLVLAEVVDEVAVVVLEVGGRGLHEALRSGNADERDLRSAVIHDLIRLIADVARALAGVLEVAGQILILGQLCQLSEAGELEIELMVAERCEIIADLVHDVDQIGACGQQTDGLALNCVAAVNKRDKVVRLFHFGLVCRNAGIAQTVAHAAVNVVGVQDHNVVGFLVCRECSGHQTQQHAYRQQKCDQFLHSILPLQVICHGADGMLVLYYKESASAIRKYLKFDR